MTVPLAFVREHERRVVFAFNYNVQKVGVVLEISKSDGQLRHPSRFSLAAFPRVSHLLGEKLPTAQRDRLLHQHSDWEIVSTVEEIANQRNVSTLPRSLDDLAHSIRAVTLNRQSPHGSMNNRIRASEPARLDSTIKTVWLDGKQVVCRVSVLAHVDRDHAQ